MQTFPGVSLFDGPTFAFYYPFRMNGMFHRMFVCSIYSAVEVIQTRTIVRDVQHQNFCWKNNCFYHTVAKTTRFINTSILLSTRAAFSTIISRDAVWNQTYAGIQAAFAWFCSWCCSFGPEDGGYRNWKFFDIDDARVPGLFES